MPKIRPRDVAALAALAALGAVAAAPAAASGHGTWQYQCMTEDNPDEPLCTTELWAAHDGEDYLVYFVHDRSRNVPFIITGGAAPFAAASIQVDDKEPLETTSCDAGMCYFAPPESTELIEQFKKGRSARVVIRVAEGDSTVELLIPLTGFSKALAP